MKDMKGMKNLGVGHRLRGEQAWGLSWHSFSRSAMVRLSTRGISRFAPFMSFMLFMVIIDHVRMAFAGIAD